MIITNYTVLLTSRFCMGKERRACKKITLSQYILPAHLSQLATLYLFLLDGHFWHLSSHVFFRFMLDRKYKKRSLC